MIKVVSNFLNKKLKKKVELYLKNNTQYKIIYKSKYNDHEKCSIILTDNTTELKCIEKTPILFISERFNKKEKLKVLKLGADRYLHSPFKKEELLLVLNNLTKPYILLEKKEQELKLANKKHQESIETIKYKNSINSIIVNSTSNIIFLFKHSNKVEKSNRAFKKFFPKKRSFSKILKNKKLFFKYIPKSENDTLLNYYPFEKWRETILLKKINKMMIRKDDNEYFFKIDIKTIPFKHDVITMSDITLMEKNFMEIKLAAMGKLTSGITHEINTPITYIKNNIELIEDSFEYIEDLKELKKETKEYIESIYDGINRVQNIVDSVKSITVKSENKKEKVNLYKSIIYSLRIIYNRAKNLAPIYINQKRFHLNLDTNEQLFVSNILKEKIEQVWLIILNNSCDEFTLSKLPYEKRKIEIEISNFGDKTKIVFKDNANKGIKKEILGKIFEPFISTKIKDGMGIGLNIAKNIIDEHNGKIKAYNEKNCAVFEVVI